MIDLFCGAGIGAVGFKLAGFNIIDAFDIKKYAVDTYNLNIGDHARVADIREMTKEDVSYADVYVAGIPCTAFSLAGKYRGVADKKKGGDLGYHFYRLVRDNLPKAFIIENVKGMNTKKHSSFFKELISLFGEIGYRVEWKLINCWHYGVPQLRERLFIVGIRSDLNRKFIFPDPVPENKRTTLRDAIGDLPEPNGENNHIGYGIRNDEKIFVDKIPPGGNWRSLPVEDQIKFLGGAFNSGGGRTGFLRKVSFDKPAYTITSSMMCKSNAQILDNHDKYYSGGYSSNYISRNRQKQWDEPSFTIVSSARHMPLHPEPPNYDIRKIGTYNVPPPRRFTVRECLRIQTVPDWFYFPEHVSLLKQYERCSGIPSLFAYKLAIAITKTIKGDS